MALRPIIVAGTSGSGKTRIVTELCLSSNEYKHVIAVTTRSRRPDDTSEYEYLTAEDFSRLETGQELLVSTEYRNHRYGIRHRDLQRIQHAGLRPVLTLTASSATNLIAGSAPATYISFFIDISDEELDRRLLSRDRDSIDPATATQRRLDRRYRDAFTYSLQNEDARACVELIRALVELDDRFGVLTARIIQLGLRCGVFLENPIGDVKGASYDLSLGDEYFYGGRIQQLSNQKPILMIEPYDYAIVTSHESANFPLNVCGRFDLAVSLFAQGIVLSNGPQVDPGFRGPLFCLLLNTSSSPVLLKRRQHYATLELYKTIEPTTPYSGQYKGKKLLDYLPPNAARGAINELKRDVENLRNESRNLQAMILAIISMILAVVAIWVSLK